MKPQNLNDDAERASQRIGQTCRAALEDLGWVNARSGRIAGRMTSDISDGTKARRYDGVGRGGHDLYQPEAYVDSLMGLDDEGHLRWRESDDPIAKQSTVFVNAITDARDKAKRAREMIAELAQVVTDARKASGKARELAGQLLTSDEEQDLRTASSVASASKVGSGAGHCSVCARYCPGIRSDRLVAARCPACLKYWDRHHREEDRPKELWGEEAEVA